MKALYIAFAAAALAAAPFVASAQTAEPAPATVEVAAAPAPPATRIPANTVIQVELAEPLSSRTATIGQTFAIRLAAPIVVDGHELVQAGAMGGGEVIDAQGSGYGGRQGKLIVSGRYLEINGQRVRIRGMQLTGVGQDRVNTALAVSMVPYAGVASIFITGGEIDMPAGASGTARLAAELDLSVVAAPAPASAEPASTREQPVTSEETQQ